MKADGEDGASFGILRSYLGFDVVDMAEVENRGEVPRGGSRSILRQ